MSLFNTLLFISIITLYIILTTLKQTNKISNFTIISISFLLILFIIGKRMFDKHNMCKVVSDIDNKPYYVRDIDDKQRASNMLARIKLNIMTLSNYLTKHATKNPKNKQYIKRLSNRINNVTIRETNGNSKHTSYSVNKGDKLIFCLRSKNINKVDKMHDINLVMYVALHEISHIACPEYGHTQLFKEIFAFFTKTAIELGIYKKIHFGISPVEYCGIVITDSII